MGKKYLSKAINLMIFLDPVRRQPEITKKGQLKGQGVRLIECKVSVYRGCTLMLGSWEKISQGFIVQAAHSDPDFLI